MFALFDVTQTLVAREMCVFPDWLVSGFCRLLAVTGYNQLQKLRELWRQLKMEKVHSKLCGSAPQPTCFIRRNFYSEREPSSFPVTITHTAQSVCRQGRPFHSNYDHNNMLATMESVTMAASNSKIIQMENYDMYDSNLSVSLQIQVNFCKYQIPFLMSFQKALDKTDEKWCLGTLNNAGKFVLWDRIVWLSLFMDFFLLRPHLFYSYMMTVIITLAFFWSKVWLFWGALEGSGHVDSVVAGWPGSSVFLLILLCCLYRGLQGQPDTKLVVKKLNVYSY